MSSMELFSCRKPSTTVATIKNAATLMRRTVNLGWTILAVSLTTYFRARMYLSPKDSLGISN